MSQYWCEPSGNLLEKWPKTGIFYIFWGPQIGSLRPSLYICERSTYDHIKQDCREFRGFFEQNSRFWLIWRPKMVQKYFCTHLKVSSESSVYFSRKQTKTYIRTYFGLISGQKRPANLVHRGHFLHTHTYTSNMPVSQVKSSHIIKLFEKMANNPKIPYCT